MKCTNPFDIEYKKNGWRKVITVPCNYCLACRITRITGWTIRIMAELYTSKAPSSFLTITYDDDNCPLTPSGQMTLRKKDIINFHKRMRHKFPKFKYFLCGEYGEELGRPHYHGIYVGLEIPENPRHPVKREIERIWGKGTIHSGTAEEASIRYCVSYIMDKNKPEHYNGSEQPFQLSSNNFGTQWIEDNYEKILNDGYINVKGKRIPIPKFLKDRYEEFKIPITTQALRKHRMESELTSIRKWGKEKAIENWNTLRDIEEKERQQLQIKLETKYARRNNKKF